jgi:hypothetical protein
MSARSRYKQLDLYVLAKKLVSVSYEITNDLPEHERNLSGQKLRGVALLFYTSIIKGLTRKSRKKFFKKAKLELFLLDGLLDVYKELHLVEGPKVDELNILLVQCLLLIKKTGYRKRLF